MLSGDICEIFTNTYFEEHLRTAAFEAAETTYCTLNMMHVKCKQAVNVYGGITKIVVSILFNTFI